MAVNIDLYEDTGALTSGRGATVTLIDNWNLKASADPNYLYFPTAETTCAPLVRPLLPGQETLSFKKYLSFKIDGTYTRIKNLRIVASIESSGEADKPRLFYKFTNTYAPPDDAFDGDMNCLSLDGVVQVPQLFPFFSTSNPQSATTRAVAYGPNQTLYTNWLVLQMRIPAGCTVGNSATFNLALTCDEN